MPITCISSWRRWWVSCLTVNTALPSAVCKVGVEMTTLHLGRLSVIKHLSVRRLCNIFRDVELGASFVPARIMTKLGSWWSNDMAWCFKSSTFAPRKLWTLIARPFLLNFYCMIPFKIESPIMTAIRTGYFRCVYPSLFVAIGLLFLLPEFLKNIKHEKVPNSTISRF